MIDEHSLKNSFRAVKADILSMQGELMNLKEQQARIIRDLDDLAINMERMSMQRQTPVKKISKKKNSKKK